MQGLVTISHVLNKNHLKTFRIKHIYNLLIISLHFTIAYKSSSVILNNFIITYKTNPNFQCKCLGF